MRRCKFVVSVALSSVACPSVTLLLCELHPFTPCRRTVLEEERVDRKKWNQSELKTAWRKNDIMTGHEDDPDIRRNQLG